MTSCCERVGDLMEPAIRTEGLSDRLAFAHSSLIVWLSSVAAFAFILGMVSTSISSAGISKSVQREIAKLGSGSIETPTGYLALVFIFFVLAVSLLVTFLWQLTGSLLGAPRWLVDLTPFAHVGLVPAQSFQLGAAVVMLALAALAALGAIRLFQRRDLAGV